MAESSVVGAAVGTVVDPGVFPERPVVLAEGSVVGTRETVGDDDWPSRTRRNLQWPERRQKR